MKEYLESIQSWQSWLCATQMIRLVIAVGGAVAGAMFGGACGQPESPGAETESPVWLMSGHDLHNTRSQPHETLITRDNAGDLAVSWMFETGGDVSATPAVDGEAIYIPDWAGNLFKLDRLTGEVIWQRTIAEHNGIPGSVSRTTPVVHGDMLILGDQAGRQEMPANVMAINKHTGDLLWITQVDSHPISVVTQSPVVFADRVYIGVASREEEFAARTPAYECCTFRGSIMALSATNGEILWKTHTAPTGYSGNAIWGGTPVVDVTRGSLYVTTGNNYTVPEDVADCVADNLGDADAVQACLAPDNHFDSVIALDLQSGAVKWATRSIPFDAWTLGCLFEEMTNCPEPAGPDYDFGHGPALFTVSDESGEQRQLLGAGQKSGKYWVFDPDTGEVVWVTQVGPGGVLGGLQWGSAVDGERIYAAVSNFDDQPWELIKDGEPTGQITNGGFFSALDARTGTILWQTPDPNSAMDQGPVTVANQVVYACSMDPQGYMYALDAISGAILWSFPSGGSCAAGAAVVQGNVYWGSGYTVLSSVGATGNNKLYAFGLP